jgi:phosphomannomutase
MHWCAVFTHFHCLGDVVSDKDGVLAAPVFYEMASFHHREGLTVKEHLQRLAQKYGEFVSYNSYVICHDPRKTDRIFERLRTGGPSGGYWTHCVGQRIVTLKDITKGYDSTSSDGKSDLPLTPDSHMLMYEFENGCSVTLRTSGTEPKIKFYTEIAGDPSKGQSRADLETILKSFVDNLVNEMLQPDENGLIRA